MSHDLTAGEKRTLLELARASIREELLRDGSRDRALGAAELTRPLRASRGAFVTIEKPDPEDPSGWTLCGCIGTLEADEPLFECAMRNAVRSALHDPRFEPLGREELPSVRVSISALTPLRGDVPPEDIVAGRDGVVMERGDAKAVFLPHVAREQGWDRLELLRNLALKAGLSRDEWVGARFWVFRAESFREDQRRLG